MRIDAVIVGARCAGAATALLLARAGARVLLIDKGVYGSDTMSTHALMRGAVLQLHRWGVLPAIVAAGTPPVRSTTFSYRDQDVTVPIEPKFGVNALYAPRRALLDRTLVDAAADSGAEVSYGVRIDDVIVDDRGRVRGIIAVAGGTRQRIEADIVIGADGLHSTIAQRVGAAARCRGPALGGRPLQLLGRPSGGRLLLAVPDAARASAPFPPTTAPPVCSRRCRRDAFAPRFTATPLPHTAG